ncbi:MAG: carboxymuconolactone decarboxylase family protein [Bacteroidales bacterium]|nr:carboxymuconolactone decarboxylase family protein [Bacteroidales bacterium]
MKKPLVSPASEKSDPALQKLIEFYNETLGFCPNSIKTMYHRPEIAYAFIGLNKAVMENKGKLSSALKRMIAYISSNAAGCRYCQAHAIRAAERYGAENDKMEHIWEYKTHPSFSEAERAALEFALVSSIIPNGVDDAIAEKLRMFWDDGEIVEMLGVIALFGFLNRWNDSMGTEMEAGAIESGEKFLTRQGWNPGKHRYTENT